LCACHFADWARKDRKAACILVKGGSVLINGCQFLAQDKRQIELTAGVRSAAIVGNQFRGGASLVNNAPEAAKIEIGLNVD